MTAAVTNRSAFTLTERQASVLCMARDRYTVPEIAAYLRVSCADVRYALVRCCQHLRVRTWPDAVELAEGIGLIGTGRVVA